MSDAFDPYRKWLGIPASEQPPNHYRLLAIALFEDDPDVIEAAADQRMAHVRTAQAGPHSALSQRILNELAAARRCLQIPETKAAYDAELRQRLDAAHAVWRTPMVQPDAEAQPQPYIPVAESIEPAPAFVVHSEPRRVPKTKGPHIGTNAAGWLAFAAIAVPAFLFVGFLVWRGPQRDDPNPSKPQAHRQQVAGRGSSDSKRAAAKPKSPPRASDDLSKPAPEGSRFAANPGKRFPFHIPDVRRASWWLDGDELVQSSLELDVTIVLGDQEWEDFDFSVEARRDEGPDACGLQVRYQDEWNAERFWLASFGNTLHRVDSADQDNVTCVASCNGGLALGQWYRLEVRMRGGHGECFLDGDSLMRFDVKRRARGRVGLTTWGSVYRFRNIVVKAPDGKVLLQGLPDLDAEPAAKGYIEDEKKMLAARGGTLPAAADGRPLNLDFETGNLQDWTAEGDAFVNQPVKGDMLHAKCKHWRSQHAGQFWIGGDARRQDSATGTLTSVPFKVTEPYASFLLAGGGLINTEGVLNGSVVELVRSDSNTPFFTAVGHGGDTLQPMVVDLSEHVGQEIFIRVADHNHRPWGRVSFDDFRLHATKPDFSPAYVSSATMRSGTTTDVLKLLDIERDSRGGQWHWDPQHRLAGGGWRIIELPVAVPNEYDLTLTLEGNPKIGEAHIWLCIGGRQVQAVIDGWNKSISGLSIINGKGFDDNDWTHRGAVMVDGRPNKIVVEVRSRSVKLISDGATVFDWAGDPSALSLPWGRHVAGADRLLVGGWGGNWILSQLDVTPIAPQVASGATAEPSTLPPVASTAPANSSAKPVESGVKPRSLADLAKEQTPARQTGLIAKELATLKQHTGAVTRVAFHPTLSVPLLASAGKDGRVLLWNLQTRALQSELHQFPNAEVWALAFSQKTGVLLFANRDYWGSTLLFKTIEGQRISIIDDFRKTGGASVVSIGISSDEQMYAAGLDDGTLRVWHLGATTEIGSIGLGDGHGVYGLVFAPPSIDTKRKRPSYLLAAAGQDGQVRTFNATFDQNKRTATLTPTNVQFPKSGQVRAIKFAPKGDMLGCTRVGGSITLYNPQTGETVRELAGGQPGEHPVQWIGFHPTRPWCITAHKDLASARIWNTDTAELLCELKGHTGGVQCAEFSPAGNTVATASEDFSIKLWTIYDPNAPAPLKRGRRR